jgi:flagellar protein FlaF
VYQAALKTYESVNKSTMGARDLEATVLAKAARHLKDCQARWGEPDCPSRMAEALKYNQRVWCIFQAELEKPENPLPAGLKMDLLRLIAFIDRRTLEVIGQPAPEKLNILININDNIAAGLRTRRYPAQTDQPAA